MKLLLTLLLSLFFVGSNLLSQSITIDYQQPTEQFPEIYRPGIFAVPKTANATNDLLNNGIYHNSIRTIDIETALNYWTVSTIDDVMAHLEVLKPNILLANSRCDKLILPILKMPLWLSSSSDTAIIEPGFSFFNAVPPANYATWNTLMDSIVEKINNQWGLDPYYEIWNEPDGAFWQGTESEYFEFFRNTFFAIKTNHPNAKVGGPTVSSFISSFTASFSLGYQTSTQLDSTIIGQVIDSCVSWGGTLDFISWHKFGVNLHVVDMEMDYLNQKLIGSGHGVVPSIISEWNLGFGFRESLLDPAYMINYSNCLKEHNIAGQTVAAWQDFETGPTEFHGDYGLLSTGALHKPSWKALLLLNKTEGELLNVDSSNYRNLNTISTYSNDTIRVLVSNYSLPGNVEAGFS
jgi:xylan 1,4-beta-xylosidase